MTNKENLLNLQVNKNYGRSMTAYAGFNTQEQALSYWASELCYGVTIWRTNATPSVSVQGWQCGGIRNEDTSNVFCDFSVSPIIDHGTVAISELSVTA